MQKAGSENRYRSCECTFVRTLCGDDGEELRGKILEKIADHKKEYKELYRCKKCGQHWEATFPGAGDICCVEPEFIRLAEDAVKRDYLA